MYNVKSLNKVILVGSIQPKEPEIAVTKNDKKKASFTLVTSSSYKKGEDWVEQAEWHNIVGWGYLANKIERLHKGDLVVVEGSLKTNKWTDNQGVDRFTTNVQAENITLLKSYIASGKKEIPDADDSAFE